MRQIDVFHIVAAVGDDDAVVVPLTQIVVEIGVNALNRRRVDGFAVKGLSGDFNPDSSDDSDVVFEKQIDDPVQKTDRVAFDAVAAAHGVAAQIRALDFRNDAVQKLVRRIVQPRIITVFQFDEIVRQIVQILVIDKDSGDRQNGLVVAVVRQGNFGQRAQIPRFVDIANLDHGRLRYN